MLTADGIKLLTCEKVSRLENGGIRFLLMKTKNNPSGKPQEVDFPRLEGEPACPAAALGDFLTIRQTSEPNTPLSVPEVTTTPDAMATGGGIISSITNSATTGTDVVSINSGAAMFLGSFIEKTRSASTMVGVFNTTTNLNATSPIVAKLSRSQQQAKKRKPSSPPKEKVTYKTIPATTTPAFALNGKTVPNTSASGAFTYEIAKPPLLKSGRVKRGDWTTVGVNSVPTTPVDTSSKAPKTTSATTTY